IFGENAAAYLCRKRRERFQSVKGGGERVGGSVGYLRPAVRFDPRAVFQKAADGQQFRYAKGTADLQTLQRGTDILCSAKGDAAFLKKAAQRVAGLPLH